MCESCRIQRDASLSGACQNCGWFHFLPVAPSLADFVPTPDPAYAVPPRSEA